MVFLIGNWKMAPERPTDALSLYKKTLSIAKKYKKISFISCVPAPFLFLLGKQAKKTVKIGAQTVAASASVAQTGLISPQMIKSCGAMYSIVGHSESRARGEDSAMVAEEVVALLKKGVTPIVCIGEQKRDQEGWYLSVVKEQIERLLGVVPKESMKKIVVAYEPVWAIGSNAVRVATPAECREMIIFIKKILTDAIGEKDAKKITILYGGSVDETNAASFITEGGAEGFLVGRVSLDPRRFERIAKNISSILQ